MYYIKRTNSLNVYVFLKENHCKQASSVLLGCHTSRPTVSEANSNDIMPIK